MAVVAGLINKGVSETLIQKILEIYPVGEKYREHNDKVKYLNHTIEKARTFSQLSDEERLDPLFVTGSLQKNKDNYNFKIVKFQEFISQTFKMKIHEDVFFRYNGRFYEPLSNKALNSLCQTKLGIHRELFTKTQLENFIHYAEGEHLP